MSFKNIIFEEILQVQLFQQLRRVEGLHGGLLEHKMMGDLNQTNSN